MEMKRILPDTLSELIMVALEDIKNLPESISINMDDWIITNTNGTACSVCLAGAIMLGNDPTGHYIDDYDSMEVRLKLYALNGIRNLNMPLALHDFYGNSHFKYGLDKEFDIFVQRNCLMPMRGKVSKRETISTMTKVANWLKERGF